MRSRNIKPGFYKNADLLECDPLARILFSGLWCLADRDGRLIDRPKQIKVELLPCDNCDVDALLNQLAKFNLIQRYEVDGEGYIQVSNFMKHQKPHIKEVASTIPAPTQHLPRQVQAPTKEVASQADSLFLIPSSLIAESLIPHPKDTSSNEEESVSVETDPIGRLVVNFKKIIEIWNETAGSSCGMVKRLTEQRRVTLRARMRDDFESDYEKWREYCRLIADTPFLCGENEKGWRADFDWCIKPSSLAKILEGKYEQQEAPTKLKKSATDLAIEKVLRECEA